MKPFSLYIHIPYCLSKCPYCDFNSYAVSSIPERDYISAVLSELDYRISESVWAGRTVNTIYFGGGTPSLFSPYSIKMIIDAVFRRLPVDDLIEITLEGNPGSLSADKLSGYAQAGVNRISIGAQSLKQKNLSILGRIHTPEQIHAAVEAARAAGIKNISLDLIYGIPGQTVDQLRSDLQSFLELEPEHISAYGLTVEEGTEFYYRRKEKILKFLDEDVLAEMLELVSSFLPAHGYPRYEISNFARTGREARHNLAYWNGDDYLGLGAGSHSFYRSNSSSVRSAGRRWENVSLPAKYIKQVVAKGQARSRQEKLSLKDLIFEFFFLGLRKTAGVSTLDFKEKFQIAVDHAYPALLEVLSVEGLIKRDGDIIALTERGLMVADSVIANFSSVEIDLSKIVRIHANGVDSKSDAEMSSGTVKQAVHQ